METLVALTGGLKGVLSLFCVKSQTPFFPSWLLAYVKSLNFASLK